MARPRKPVDAEALVKLAERQWTIEEIAAFFSVSRDTIERRFAAKVLEGKNRGRAKLRDLQWTVAMKGNAAMIIHMSKHYLDQRDRVELEDLRFADKKEALQKLEEAAKRLRQEIDQEF